MVAATVQTGGANCSTVAAVDFDRVTYWCVVLSFLTTFYWHWLGNLLVSVRVFVPTYSKMIQTLAVRGLEEHCASFPDFCDNYQFHVISCVYSHLWCTLFRRISDSWFTWIHDSEENLTESVGPVPFSAQYLICRPVQMDGQTDRQTDRRTN